MRSKEYLLAVAATGFALLLGEVSVRLLLPKPYKVANKRDTRIHGMPRFSIDPEIGWVNEPSDETYHFTAKGPAGSTDAIYHMHQGLRDSSAKTGIPSAGPVLVVTGCSFTYGYGISDSDTWPWMLQEQLPDYHVANVATMAYGTAQSLMRAERFVKNSPAPVKLVVYALADFHVDRDRAYQRDLWSLYPTGRPRFRTAGDGLRDYGLVYFLAPGKLLEHSDLLMHGLNHAAEIYNKTPGEDESREIALRLLKQSAARWKEKNVAFAVVILPHGSDRGPYSTRTRNFLVGGLRQAGIPVLVPEFPRKPDGNIDRARYLLPSDVFHPNHDFNGILSGDVAKFITAEVAPTHLNSAVAR